MVELKIKETREIVITIPVTVEKNCIKLFHDNKEITELFNYVYERSLLNIPSHCKNTFSIRYDSNAYMICEFTLSLPMESGNTEYEQRRSELEMLVNEYVVAEREYLRFKAFGQIETGVMIRMKR
jgi:hypothetical protein